MSDERVEQLILLLVEKAAGLKWRSDQKEFPQVFRADVAGRVVRVNEHFCLQVGEDNPHGFRVLLETDDFPEQIESIVRDARYVAMNAGKALDELIGYLGGVKYQADPTSPKTPSFGAAGRQVISRGHILCTCDTPGQAAGLVGAMTVAVEKYMNMDSFRR
jgi:hypothetical protein